MPTRHSNILATIKSLKKILEQIGVTKRQRIEQGEREERTI